MNVLMDLKGCQDPKIRVFALEGDALIGRSRSRAATKFYLEKKHDLLMFIDDDIVSSTLDITKLLWSCWKLQPAIVCGAYPLKDMNKKTFAIYTKGYEKMVFGEGGMLYEIDYGSTGFMAIHGGIFSAMVLQKVVNYCASAEGESLYPFFNSNEIQREDGSWIYLSEDWHFCHLAKKLGFKVYVDSTIKLGHIGSYIYTWGDFGREPKQEIKNLNCKISRDLPKDAETKAELV
jgi:hypothetical protein